MRYHRVRVGERLSQIAALHGVPVANIVAANPEKPTMRLASGETVFAALSDGEDIALGLGAPQIPHVTPIHPCPQHTAWNEDAKRCLTAQDWGRLYSVQAFQKLGAPQFGTQQHGHQIKYVDTHHGGGAAGSQCPVGTTLWYVNGREQLCLTPSQVEQLQSIGVNLSQTPW